MDRPGPHVRTPLLCGIAAALAGATFATAARADEPATLDLSWEAPGECPDGAHVIAEIERLAGRAVSADRASGDVKRLSVKAIVTRGDRGLSVAITSEAAGATHTRNVDAPTCKEAADAAALIIAMALDPGLAPPSDTPAPPPTAASEPDPGTNEKKALTERPPPRAAAEPDKMDAPRAAPSRSIEVRGEARAMFAFDAAALPSPAPGLAGALGLWIGPFRIDAIGAVFPEQRKTLDNGGGGDVGLATGGLAAWITPLRRPLDVLAGAGIEAGAIWGHGFGVDGARAGVAPWIALRAGAGAAYSFTPRLGASLAASLVLPLARERFLLGSDELFVPAPASLRLEAGFFVRFP